MALLLESRRQAKWLSRQFPSSNSRRLSWLGIEYGYIRKLDVWSSQKYCIDGSLRYGSWNLHFYWLSKLRSSSPCSYWKWSRKEQCWNSICGTPQWYQLFDYPWKKQIPWPFCLDTQLEETLSKITSRLFVSTSRINIWACHRRLCTCRFPRSHLHWRNKKSLRSQKGIYGR